jgi:hypothetical protein
VLLPAHHPQAVPFPHSLQEAFELPGILSRKGRTRAVAAGSRKRAASSMGTCTGGHIAPAPSCRFPLVHDMHDVPISSAHDAASLSMSPPASLLTMSCDAPETCTVAEVRPHGSSRAAAASATDPTAELTRHIRTSDQVIEFYAQYGQDSPVTFFFCKQADTGLLFRPYDLVVVKREDAGNDYYTISATGVMHMRRGVRAGAARHSTFLPWPSWLKWLGALAGG